MKRLLSVITVVGLGVGFAGGGVAAVAPATTPIAPPPLVFEANRGQVDARVQFVARGAGYTAFLAPSDGAVDAGSPAAATATSTPDATPETRTRLLVGISRCRGREVVFAGRKPLR